MNSLVYSGAVSTYYVPGIFLGAEDKVVNTINNVFALMWCLHLKV